MINEVLKSIEGVGIYPTISLLLFFTVFTIMAIRTYRLDKKYCSRMKNLPLDGEDKDE